MPEEISPPVQLPEVKLSDVKAAHGSNPPPAEKIKSINFDSSSFDPLKDFSVEQLPKQPEKKEPEVKKEDVKKAEDPEKKAEKKEEIKKEEQVKSGVEQFLKPPAEKKEEKKEEKKGEIQQIKLPEKGQRDYTGYSPEETAALKQMGNEGFNLAAKLIKDNKELKKLENSTYLEHESAYVLDPQYQQMQRETFLIDREAQYWKQCLMKLDAGEGFKPLMEWDDQGNPVYGAEIKPSKEAEINVQTALNQCLGMVNQKRGEIQAYPSKYKQQIQLDRQAINQIRAQHFEWVAKPELENHTMDVGGQTKSIKDIKTDMRNMFPLYLRNHPAVEIVGDMMVALRIAEMQISQANNGKAVEAIKEEEVTRAEPSSEQRPVAQGKNKYGGPTTFVDERPA